VFCFCSDKTILVHFVYEIKGPSLATALLTQVRLVTRSPHKATERHLPYGITQFYLPPDTQVNAPRLKLSQIGRYSIYLPRRSGRL